MYCSFSKYMSPYIIHFDPALHTFEYVQQSSPFLLVSILSASARIFNPELYPKLYQYSEELLAKTFVFGDKSVEIIQAVLMKTYWKEPDDSRVWQLVGYASRMCTELRGRKSRTPKRRDSSMAASEPDLRKQRNLERTWLTLFVYDRRYVEQNPLRYFAEV
jgi:Fungal specific transcription factor domain